MIVLLLNARFTIVSTGGTAAALESAGVAVTKVEQITQFPEMVSFFVTRVPFPESLFYFMACLL